MHRKQKPRSITGKGDDIGKLRKELSRIESWFTGRWKKKNKEVKEELNRKYKIKEKGFKHVMDEIKQRILAKSTKIRRYIQRNQQYSQNKMFASNQKRFYNNISNKSNTRQVDPDPEKAKEFWKSLWDVPVSHNKEAQWLKDIKSELTETPKQEDIEITSEDVKQKLSQTPNWKSPGLDGIQGYWLKNYTSLHERIATQLNECVTTGDIPEWMVESRTTLIMKDPRKRNHADNFRPIACLNLLWKLLTGIVADKTYDHLEANKLFPSEQKGGKRNSKGTKDKLLIDKAILQNCKRRKTNLAMAWIDPKKAYDLVPHSWIIESLKMVGVAENIIDMLGKSMQNWKTHLQVNNSTLGVVDINRGIFQGDSFSPLIFVITLIPLTMTLRKVKQGYYMKKGVSKVNHLLYMDDVKLYASQSDDIDSLVQTVRVCTQDLGMKFGIKKCATLVLKRGKISCSEGINLGNNEIIGEVGTDGYKYLGIAEKDGICHEQVKESTRKEYFKRLTSLCKSKLNSGNLFQAIKTWAVPLLRYGAGNYQLEHRT